MATSGTYDAVEFTVATLLDQAALRVGKMTSQITAEDIQTALREFNLILTSDYSNRGLKLWTIEVSYYGLYVGQRAYQMGTNTVDVKNLLYRTYTRLTGSGTGTSSSGGTVEYAFDGDTGTSCTQTAPNGNIKYYFGTPVAVSFVGILPNATSTMSYVIEASSNDVDWVEYMDLGSVSFENGMWYWTDLPSFETYAYWRIRETAGGTIDVREVVFANNTTDINLYRLTRDDYTTLPNKAFTSRPTQYWWDRDRTNPQVVLWPVPNSTFDVLNAYRTRNIQDITSIAQEVEVPRRWWNVLVECLANQLRACNIGNPETGPGIEKRLAVALALAENEEQDSGNVYLAPNLSGYTRG